MFKNLIIAATLVIATCSYAGQISVDTDGLTASQVAELKAHAAAVVAEAAKGKDNPGAAKDTASAVLTIASTFGQ